jgi:hypothetical protein
MSKSMAVMRVPLTSSKIRMRIGIKRPVNKPVNRPTAKLIQNTVLIKEPSSPGVIGYLYEYQGYDTFLHQMVAYGGIVVFFTILLTIIGKRHGGRFENTIFIF